MGGLERGGGGEVEVGPWVFVGGARDEVDYLGGKPGAAE